MVKIELGQTVDKLGNLFNSFRNTQTKDEALGHLYKTFTDSFQDKFDFDKFASNDNKSMQLATTIAKAAMKSGAVSGGLTMAGLTEGFSAIPVLFESVLEGISSLFAKEQPKQESFFPGEWVSIQVGFVKDNAADITARDQMFGDAMFEQEIPNYNVGFFIGYAGKEDRCTVFDAREGCVKEVAVPDVRSIPDQESLDHNELLREIKEVYFKKEGKHALARTRAEVAVGKDVMFNNVLYNVLEFEPVKQLVHLTRAGETIETALSNIKSFDADHMLTWLDGKTLNQFPRTVVKHGYCWLPQENNEVLCLVRRISGNTVDLVECATLASRLVANTEPLPVSEKFAALIGALPEFKRFRKAIMRGTEPWEIYKYRYLCKQSAVNRSIDALDTEALKNIVDTEKKEFGFVDEYLGHEIESLEAAYNEKVQIEI